MTKIQATCAIIINNKNDFLLTKRAREPFKGYWALVSGIGETKKGLPLKDAIIGEVECDLQTTFLGLRIFTEPTINDNFVYETAVFLGKVDESKIHSNLKFSEQWKWFSIDEISSLGELAFQHEKIIDRYLKEK